MNRAELSQIIAEVSGLDTEGIGLEGFQRAVQRLKEVTGIRDDEGFYRIFHDNPKHLEILLESLVVPETWFFRDSEPFHYLFDLAQKRRAQDLKAIRVLSVPCATGEEPYSIAMVLLASGYSAGEIHVDAIDLSRVAIQKAHQAKYGKRSFRETGWEELTNRFFSHEEEIWTLSPEVVPLVHFHNQNVSDQKFFLDCPTYDIVFCRNLVIYLSESARNSIVKNIQRLLSEEGTLFVGHSEMLFFCRNGFEPIPRPRAFSCRKEVRSPETAKPAMEIAPPKPVSKEIILPRPVAGKTIPAAEGKAAIRIGSERPETHPAVPSGAAQLENRAEMLASIRNLADKGLLKDAEARCRELACQPNANAEIFCLLGTICAAKEDIVGAESAFSKAIYLDPECYNALVQLSLIREHQGDSGAASRLRERARKAFRRGELRTTT